MNSKELFGLFLRIYGVLGIVFIVRHVLGLVPSLTACPAYVIVYLTIKWMIGALVGLYFVRGAPLMMKFAYPEKPGIPAQ